MHSKAHFHWIDFLRGISALGIVLFHVRVDLWVGWEAIRKTPNAYSVFDRNAALLSIPTPFFGSAVMLFFLVSGFCVHYPYAAGRELELKPYGIRRWLRIYPPYLFAILLGIVIEAILKVCFALPHSTFTTVALSTFMVQNFSEPIRQMTSNVSLWSLPVEVELYLAYSIFYWFAKKWGWKYAFLIVTSVSLATLGLSLRFSGGITHHFAGYWVIWCAGAMLAQGVTREKLPVWHIGLGGVTLAAFVSTIASHLLKLPSLVQCFAGAGFYFMIMLWGLTHPEALNHIGEPIKKGILFIGTISYSLYLIHFPVFRLGGVLWLSHFGTKPANFLIPLFFTLLIIPAAACFHYLIEVPSHQLARRSGRQNSLAHVSIDTPLLAGNADADK